MSQERHWKHHGRVIRAQISSSAAPERLWQAWTDPQKISHWFTDKATGDPRVGAAYTWEFEGYSTGGPLEVLEAVPNQSLVLAGFDPAAQRDLPGVEPSITEIRIEHHGGQTVVTLVNSGFDDREEFRDEVEGVESGWPLVLARLQLYAENYFDEPRRSFDVLRPAEYSYEGLLPYFRETAGLSRWLTTSGSVDRPGDPCELAFRDGGKLTGRVLTVTKREVSVSWSEVRGALEFSAFKMHGQPQHVLGLRVIGWGLEASRAAEIRKEITPAVERLAAAFTRF